MDGELKIDSCRMIIPNAFIFEGIYKCKRCGAPFKAHRATIEIPCSKAEFFDMEDSTRGALISNNIYPELRKYNPTHCCNTLKYDYGFGELVGAIFKECI